MTIAYLSLGSNLGDRASLLADAARRLEAPGTKLRRVSGVFETAPQGKTEQPAFLNLVVEIETELLPGELLRHTQSIETELGRLRLERWGPRTVDIDLLLFGDAACHSENLEIPHPRMLERAFVLVPLGQLLPAFTHPQRGTIHCADLIAHLVDQQVTPFLSAEDFTRMLRRGTMGRT